MKIDPLRIALLILLAVSIEMAWISSRNHDYQKTNPAWYPQHSELLKLEYLGPAKEIPTEAQLDVRTKIVQLNPDTMKEGLESDHVFRLRNIGNREAVFDGWNPTTPSYHVKYNHGHLPGRFTIGDKIRLKPGRSLVFRVLEPLETDEFTVSILYGLVGSEQGYYTFCDRKGALRSASKNRIH